jgi:hypothetical protein
MTSPPTRPRPSEPGALPGWLLAAWAATGIALVVLAVLSIRRDRADRRADWHSRLARVADDRVALAERTLQLWRDHVHHLGTLQSVRPPVAPAGLRSERETVLEAGPQELDEVARRAGNGRRS